MSESTGSRSKMICREMFVFCSGHLVSLTFGVSCQRSRPSEIRWLNVKQPTSTRLWLDLARTRSQVKLVMSESFAFCLSLSVSLASGIGHERVELSSTVLDPALSFRTHRRRRLRLQLERDQRLDHDQARSSSQSWRAQLNLERAAARFSRESCLSSVTYRSDPRVWCSPRVARRLSDRNCELSANTPRGLETYSGVIGHSYLH